jgi:hypothetical protein
MKKCLERVVQRKVHCESRGDMWFNKRVLTFQKNLLHPCVCTLVMRAVNASEVAMRMTQSTRLHFPEDSNLFLIMVCSRCASKKNSVSQKILMLCLLLLVCENRSVGIATCYKLEGEISCTCPNRPWGLHIILYYGYRVIPGGKEPGA